MDEQTQRQLEMVWNTLDALVVKLGLSVEDTVTLLLANRQHMQNLTDLHARVAQAAVAAHASPAKAVAQPK